MRRKGRQMGRGGAKEVGAPNGWGGAPKGWVGHQMGGRGGAKKENFDLHPPPSPIVTCSWGGAKMLGPTR